MKITVVSDLHLEFSGLQLANKQGADVLVLSGDIMIAEDLHDHPNVATIYDIDSKQKNNHRQRSAVRYREFFKSASENFKDVVYVAGNHEFYHGKWYSTLGYLREECKKYPNVHFLECDTVTINNVTFVGGTLWTNMNKYDPMTLHAVRDLMNDFQLIRNDNKGFTALKPADTCERHRNTLSYIREVVLNVRELEDPTHRIVVVGHHTPSHLSMNPMYAHDYLMNGAYHSDLSEFILDHPEIVLWTHGHTHHTFDYKIGETRIVCNPRGYEDERGYGEDTGWDPHMIVEI